mgnify:FL=1
MRTQGEEWRSGREEAVRQLKSKEEQFAEELAKLNNRVRLQQADIERLNEITSKK